MDNLRLAWDVPCEDEIATNVLSGGASPYMAINFMRDWRRYMRFIKFASPDSAEQFERWRSAFLYFCRKLVCNSKPGQRLLLKSPCHTGRVSVLNKLFDDTACFVFVHRDPHDIFLSSHAALVDRYIRPCAALQIFSPSDAQNYVLGQGRILHEAYMTDVKGLAPDRVATIAFADLAADQSGAMKCVYEQLGMADRFEQVRPAFAAYAAEVADYKKNTFPPPTEEAIGVVNRQWAEMFRDLGYDRRQQ
jgi:omega-hydroxy-beta-dihydromenaquinone-9 sulfotransferase